MNRNKVLELAREADLYMTSDERIAAVERFAALIEAEVRGDAEPVAYSMRFNDDERLCLSTVFDTEDEAHEYAEKCSYTTVVPLYTHPAPAVVRELVEALELCRFTLEPYDDIKPCDWKSDRENLRRAHQQSKAALVAAVVQKPLSEAQITFLHGMSADGDYLDFARLVCGDGDATAS